MHYLPLPRTVVPAVAMATVILVIWLGWGSMRDPEALWAPGDLSRYHGDIARCTSCHEPFRGPATTKCILCHSDVWFTDRRSSAAAYHLDLVREQKTCLACHTEHRGALAPITSTAMMNPHGEFVFLVAGTNSCAACHEFEPPFGTRPTLLDNNIVRHVMARGGGAHRPGHMAHCLQCHTR
jgi:hypothetical protein